MRSKNLGMISAVVGSVCCVGPALLALLGLFGFAGGFFAKYHWYFIAAGVIGVSAAWWQFGREKRKLHALAARMRNEETTRAVLALATVVMVVVLGFSVYPLLARPANSAAGPLAASASLQTVTLPVSGMDCAICAVPIQARLHELTGVGKVDVNVPDGKVTVDYDPGKVKLDQLVAAISSTGYKASLPK